MDVRKHALRTVQCALRTMVPNPSPMPPERPALATSSDFSDNFVPFKEEGCWSGGDGSPASGVLSLIRFAVWAGNLSSGAADSRDPSLGVARGNGLSPPHFRVCAISSAELLCSSNPPSTVYCCTFVTWLLLGDDCCLPGVFVNTRCDGSEPCDVGDCCAETN